MSFLWLKRFFFAWAAVSALLQSWGWMLTSANAESIELRIDQVSGLTKDVKGRTEYLVSVHACSPVCALIGYESLAEKTTANVLSAEGIRGNFRLSVKLHRRTRPPPQERGLIPVEVVEREEPHSDPTDGTGIETGVHVSDSQPIFEPYGRVLITGSRVGERGNLNHNWREKDELIAEYTIDTTTSAVRRCRKSCSFHSGSSFVRSLVSNATADTPSFHLQLAAFPDSSSERTSPDHFLLAAHFAEAVEQSTKEDLFLPFEFPGETTTSLQNSKVSFRYEGPKCTQYRFIAAVGDDVAFVWHMSRDKEEERPLQKDRLDTRPNQGATVIVFKDIDKSNKGYADAWGRNELSPVIFTGASTYDHFESFGKVHTGFHKRYNQVAEELRTWVRPGTRVLITGASAGGALASLAYADWLSDSDMDLGLSFGVTFGAPQVGDKKFQKAFRELGRFEPSKAKYGFFEQLVAADEKTGKVDIATTLPSAIFEGLVPYPGIHSIDCLRSVIPVERTALSAPGHLRAFRSVGRRRYLYSGKRLKAAAETKTAAAAAKASNDTLGDMADLAFMVQGDVMAHYIERLYSLYYDIQEMRFSHTLRTVSRFQQPRQPNASLEVHTCKNSPAQQDAQALSVNLEVSIQNDKTYIPKTVAVQVCDECSKKVDSGCRPFLIVGDASNTGGGLVAKGQKTAISFLSLRPVAKNACVQFLSNKMHSPPTCATDVLPKESVRLASSQLIELKELLACKKERRCQMQFDGMTLLIEGGMRKVLNESELVERAGFSNDGVLMQGEASVTPLSAERHVRPPRSETSLSNSGSEAMGSAVDDSSVPSTSREEPIWAKGIESQSDGGKIKEPFHPEMAQPGMPTAVPTTIMSGTSPPEHIVTHISPIGKAMKPAPNPTRSQSAVKLGDLAGGVPVSADSMTGPAGGREVASGGCESGTHCKCVSTTVSGCGTPVAGQLGWCSVESSCERMRCGCEGEEICEKRAALVFEIVEAVGGDRYARCESRVEEVAVRVGRG